MEVISFSKRTNRFRGDRGHFPAVKRPERETDHSFIVFRLRISGPMPPFPLFAFMAWIGTALALTFRVFSEFTSSDLNSQFPHPSSHFHVILSPTLSKVATNVTGTLNVQ